VRADMLLMLEVITMGC